MKDFQLGDALAGKALEPWLFFPEFGGKGVHEGQWTLGYSRLADRKSLLCYKYVHAKCRGGPNAIEGETMTLNTAPCNDSAIEVTLRIGVTGHRNLSNKSLLRAKAQEVLGRLEQLLSHTPHRYVVISSLAEGADRLVAKTVLEWPASTTARPLLEVILPFAQGEYLQDFESEESKLEFRGLLDQAACVHVVKPTLQRREAYRRAGEEVVRRCDLLIAIWDGGPAAGIGGTGDIVEYARKTGRPLYWIDSVNGDIAQEGTLPPFRPPWPC